MHYFEELVGKCIALRRNALGIPLGCYEPLKWPALHPAAPTALIFSPHPDDEILIGPLALRLRRAGWRIVVIAMTLGKPEQRERRRRELERACAYIGFELEIPSEEGLLPDQGGEASPNAMYAIEDLLERHAPRAIIMHHELDAHHAHRATHDIVEDALLDMQWDGDVFKAEYWSDMDEPNLLLEVSPQDLGILLRALSFHEGELKRNPYHIRWPAAMMRAVSRSEIVLGRGTEAPDMDFAVHYRICRSDKGFVDAALLPQRILRAQDSVEMLFR